MALRSSLSRLFSPHLTYTRLPRLPSSLSHSLFHPTLPVHVSYHPIHITTVPHTNTNIHDDTNSSIDKIDLFKMKIQEERKKGLISEDTLKKLEALGQEQIEMKKSFNRIGSEIGGHQVVKFGGLKDMTLQRWYNDVLVKEVPENGKWSIYLDDRLIVTKNEKGLYLPTKDMAMAIASEWDEQEGLVCLTTMPLMNQVCRAIDDMPAFRDYYDNEIIDFLLGDSVCFRDDGVTPKEIKKQQKINQPIVDWFNQTMGLHVSTSNGCVLQLHPQKTMDTIKVYLNTLDSFTFHALHTLTHVTKSLLTAFAVWHNTIAINHAVEVASLEEDINIEQSGLIEGIHDLKKAQLASDIYSASIILQLCGVPPPSKETFELFGDCTALLEEQQRLETERHKKLNDLMYEKLDQYIETEIQKKGEGAEAQLLRSFSASVRERKEELDKDLLEKKSEST